MSSRTASVSPLAPMSFALGRLDVDRSPLRTDDDDRCPSAKLSACSTASASRGRTSGIDLQAIDDDLDVVLDPAIELQVVGQADDLAIDAGADEAALEHVGEEVLVFALLAADHRSEDEEARAFRQGEDAAEDLLARLGGDRPAAVRAVALADAGVEDAEVIVDLGDGADGGARIAAGGLLLDADRRRQAGEVIDIRLLQLAEELPGVARQRFDVAALPLGVERVEGQRALARAADAGEDDQLVAGQVEIDVAEVVLARRG